MTKTNIFSGILTVLMVSVIIRNVYARFVVKRPKQCTGRKKKGQKKKIKNN